MGNHLATLINPRPVYQTEKTLASSMSVKLSNDKIAQYLDG